MKSLFSTCLGYISKNLVLFESTEHLPKEVNEWLLDWVSSHDLLAHTSHTSRLIWSPGFIQSIRHINFYSSDELSDDFLINFSKHNILLEHIAILFCPNVTEEGIRAITRRQKSLVKLELRGISSLTSRGLALVQSPRLNHVDLSECKSVSNAGLINVIEFNPAITHLLLNNCTQLTDAALFGIANVLGERLMVLELDSLCLSDPSLSLSYLTQRCPNLHKLSLCCYFKDLPAADQIRLDCCIGSGKLRDLDLYGNYLELLPALPPSIRSIRLSFTGSEHYGECYRSLSSLPELVSLKLILNANDDELSPESVKTANGFLTQLLLDFGHLVTSLQIAIPSVEDIVMWTILDYCINLRALALDVRHASLNILQYYFQEKEKALQLRSLKFHKVKLSYKLLVSIARFCLNLEELEVSWMQSVDDKFLSLVAGNCPQLHSVNLNGCYWATDKGVCELARKCPLKEIRVRATGCTDKCVYVLAQCCSGLEWISHADYSGKPIFSNEALDVLRASCVQKVIC